MKSVKTASLLIGICLTISLFSQPPVPGYDPAAKKILDGVSKTMRKDSTKTATFTLTVKNANGKTDTATGEIITKKRNYRIILKKGSKPYEEYYNDGKTKVIYSWKDHEVTSKEPADTTSIFPSPTTVFTLYEKGFTYQFIKEDTLNENPVQYIDLYPVDAKRNYDTVHLTIDKKNKQITNIVFMNKDGSVITYHVDSFIPNLMVPDGIFHFDLSAH